MNPTLLRVLAVVFSISVSCCGAEPPGKTGETWVSREDNGDKPGVEFRVSHLSDGKLTVEMWLFTLGTKGEEKERGKYPVTILKSDAMSISFNYEAGAGGKDEVKLVFKKALADEVESGVLIDLPSHRETNLTFRRIGAKK